MYPMEWIKIQLTRKCNLNCKYCSQAEFDRTHDLNIETLKKSVIEPSKIRLLIISGGEPLVCLEKLLDIVSFCSKKGIETGIFSNATLITDEKARLLKDAGISWIRVSVNGHNAITHELSYPKESFERTINGIKILLKNDIYVKVRSTITKCNINSIEDITNFVENMGIKEIDFRPYLHLGECNPHGDYALDTESELEALTQLIKLQEKKENIYIKLLPNWFDFLIRDLTNVPEKVKIEDCYCGRKYLYIDSDGNYRPCAGHRLILGNINNLNVQSVWDNSIFLKEIRNYKQNKYCLNCPMHLKCHTANCHLINYELDGSFEAVNRTCPILNYDSQNSQNGYEIVRKKFKEIYNRI